MVALDTREGLVPAIARAFWRQAERALLQGLLQERYHTALRLAEIIWRATSPQHAPGALAAWPREESAVADAPTAATRGAGPTYTPPRTWSCVPA